MPFSSAELKERQGFLGASEASAALGLSSWFTPLQLYMSKVGDSEPIESTIPMMVGTALEPIAIELFEREYGMKVTERQTRFSDKSRPWRRCTVDGMADDGSIIEAKSSGDFRGWGDGDDEIPLPYIYNIAHSFACIPEARRAFFPVLIGGRNFKVYEVKRQNDLIELVTKGEDAFWKHVEKLIPPPPTNADDLKILYPRDHGLTRAATEAEEALVARLKVLKAVRKNAEKDEEDVAQQVKSVLGECAALMGSNFRPIVTWKTQEASRIDVKLLRERRPEIASEFTVTDSKRVLLVK